MPRDALVVEMEGPLGLVRISGLATYNALRPALRDQLSLMECSLATFTFAEPEDDQDGSEAGQQPTAPAGPPSVPQPVVRPDIAPADGG